MKILMINGSPHPRGCTYTALHEMERVLQAAGRVIRTDTDRGVVLLIDSRYARPPYTELMPQEWQMHYLSQEERSYRDLLEDFWE